MKLTFFIRIIHIFFFHIHRSGQASFSFWMIGEVATTSTNYE
jgi:hypothetical protein